MAIEGSKLDYEPLDCRGQVTDIHVPWLLLTPYTLEQRVLLIGCESVFTISGLAAKSAVVYICTFGEGRADISFAEASLPIAENIKVINSGMFPKLPFDNESFDLCVVGGRLLTPGKPELLSEISRVLSVKGTLFLSVKKFADSTMDA